MIRLPVMVSRGLKLIFSPQNIGIKIFFFIENEDLTQLRHLNNGSFRETSSGVLKLLHTLLFTKYTILLGTLNCKLC